MSATNAPPGRGAAPVVSGGGGDEKTTGQALKHVSIMVARRTDTAAMAMRLAWVMLAAGPALALARAIGGAS